MAKSTGDQQQWDVVVVGGANMDFLVRGVRLPKPGETVQGDMLHVAPGGKGANQAVAAARLGARVALVARVGDDDWGEDVLEQLKREGVDARYVAREKDRPTGIALVMVGEGGQKQILTAPGANFQFGVDDVLAAEQAIRSARVLLMQLEVPTDAVLHAAQMAHEAGAKIVLDPSPPIGLPDELLHIVDLMKPNVHEAEAITGVHVHDRDTAREAARRLLDRGVKWVVVEAGDYGNLCVTPEQECWLPKIPIENVIDATGAGDAFAATMAVALAEGRSWSEAGSWGSAAAALKTRKLGAQAGMPSRSQVLELAARGEVRIEDAKPLAEDQGQQKSAASH